MLFTATLASTGQVILRTDTLIRLGQLPAIFNKRLLPANLMNLPGLHGIHPVTPSPASEGRLGREGFSIA